MSTVQEVTAIVPASPARKQSLLRAVLRTGEGRIGIGLGVFMIGLIVIGALFGPTTDYNAAAPGSGSSAAHWFGTDALGRDVLSRFLHGGTTVLLIPLVAVTLSLIIGGSLGLFGAYWGGWPDVVISKVFDVILTLPPLLIVLVIIGGLGASDTVLIITVALVYAPGMGRVVRGTAQSVIVNPYVLSAQARGEREFGLRLTYGILFVATLSFLGLGVQPPASDWGLMVAENRGLITVAPWGTLLPALGITALAVALNLSADALSRVLAGDDLSRLAVI
jgi:peptide/nickel transport system permease protein